MELSKLPSSPKSFLKEKKSRRSHQQRDWVFLCSAQLKSECFRLSFLVGSIKVSISEKARVDWRAYRMSQADFFDKETIRQLAMNVIKRGKRCPHADVGNFHCSHILGVVTGCCLFYSWQMTQCRVNLSAISYETVFMSLNFITLYSLEHPASSNDNDLASWYSIW